MSVPVKLVEEFKKLRPELLDSEFTAEKCASILRDIVQKKTGPDEAYIRLQTKLKLCQDELRLSLGASEDIRALKVKAAHIMDQFTKEKEHAQEAKEKQGKAERRAIILADHSEKLMKCLKGEATLKMKQIEANRRERKLAFGLTQKLNEKAKIVDTQKRLIAELREGAYIMENQLRLMDERYYELRGKLDTARANQRYYVEKFQKQAKDLRTKFTLIHGPRYTLDQVPIPDETTIGAEIARSVDFFGMGANNQSIVAESPDVHPGKIRPSTSKASFGRNGSPAAASHGEEGLNPQQLELLRASKQGSIKSKRAQSAPGGKRGGGGGKRKGGGDMGKDMQVSWGFEPSGNDEKDVDMLITKIYSKSKLAEEDRWTPEALTKLVADDRGKVSCAIPDIVPQKQTDTDIYAANRRSQLEGH